MPKQTQTNLRVRTERQRHRDTHTRSVCGVVWCGVVWCGVVCVVSVCLCARLSPPPTSLPFVFVSLNIQGCRAALAASTARASVSQKRGALQRPVFRVLLHCWRQEVGCLAHLLRFACAIICFESSSPCLFVCLFVCLCVSLPPLSFPLPSPFPPPFPLSPSFSA